MPAPALVLHDRPTCRFAVNALVAAVGAHPASAGVPVEVARSPGDVAAAVARARAAAATPVVGWSFHTADVAAIAAELAQVRAASGGGAALHLAGGAHPSGAPAATLAMGFDLVAIGEGEETLPRVLGAVAAGGDPRAVPGLAWLDAGRLRTSGRAPPVDLATFPPFPAGGRRFGPIELTRGCIWACRFCQTPYLHRARFRHRTLDDVRRAVRALRAARPNLDVRFITPSALSWGSQDGGCDLDAVEALLAAVREEAGPRRVMLGTFPSELRPEHVTPRTLALLRRYCDNRVLILGGQSGSERLLAEMGRGHGAVEVTRAAAVALEAGFRPSVDFVFGLPGETGADREATRRQIEDLARLGARVHAHAFDPLPGTPWAREPAGRVDPETAALLARLHASGRVYGEWTDARGAGATRIGG